MGGKAKAGWEAPAGLRALESQKVTPSSHGLNAKTLWPLPAIPVPKAQKILFANALGSILHKAGRLRLGGTMRTAEATSGPNGIPKAQRF